MYNNLSEMHRDLKNSSTRPCDKRFTGFNDMRLVSLYLSKLVNFFVSRAIKTLILVYSWTRSPKSSKTRIVYASSFRSVHHPPHYSREFLIQAVASEKQGSSFKLSR